MPFPARASDAESIIKKLKTHFEKGAETNLRAQLASRSSGGVIKNTERLKQVELLEATYAQIIEDNELTQPSQLRTMIGALLFVQMENTEDYDRSIPSKLTDTLSLGFTTFSKPDSRSNLYNLINEIPELQACLQPLPNEVSQKAVQARYQQRLEEETSKGSLSDTQIAELKEKVKDEVRMAVREKNMREGLAAFWDFYKKHTFNELKTDTGIELLPKVSDNIFEEAFAYMVKGKNPERDADGKIKLKAEDKEHIQTQADRFSRQLRRYRLSEDLSEAERSILDKDRGRPDTDDAYYTKLRMKLLSDIFKPKAPQAENVAKTGWLPFFGTGKKTDAATQGNEADVSHAHSPK